MDAIAAHDLAMARYALERLRELDGVAVYGPESRGALAAFSLEGVHPHDLASLLDERGIAVRAGHHCAQPLHERLGLAATTRASFYLYNDPSEIDVLVDGIYEARKVLGA